MNSRKVIFCLESSVFFPVIIKFLRIHPVDSSKNGLLNGEMNSEPPSGVKNQKLATPDITAVSGASTGVGTQEVSPARPTEIIELCSP